MSFIKENRKEIITVAVSIASVLAISYVFRRFIINHTRLQFLAKKDLRRWNGKTETDPSVSSDLVGYWELAGMNFTNKQMQQASTHSSYPWSAVYISHLVEKSGYKNFNPKSTHSGYIVDAKKRRAENKNKSYWAYKPSENKTVQIGDILVKGRSGTNPNLDTINSGVLSHGDIVIDIKKIDGKKYAITQGGNLSNTVKQVNVPLTDSNILLNPVHFAHLKYKN